MISDYFQVVKWEKFRYQQSKRLKRNQHNHQNYRTVSAECVFFVLYYVVTDITSCSKSESSANNPDFQITWFALDE